MFFCSWHGKISLMMNKIRVRLRRAYHGKEQVGPQVLSQGLGDLVSDTHAMQLRAGPEDGQHSVRSARRPKRGRQVLQRVQLQQQLQAALVHKLPGEGLVGQQRLEHARGVHDALGHMRMPVRVAVARALRAAHITFTLQSKFCNRQFTDHPRGDSINGDFHHRPCEHELDSRSCSAMEHERSHPWSWFYCPVGLTSLLL